LGQESTTGGLIFLDQITPEIVLITIRTRAVYASMAGPGSRASGSAPEEASGILMDRTMTQNLQIGLG
jgi:hypothetical protein